MLREITEISDGYYCFPWQKKRLSEWEKMVLPIKNDLSVYEVEDGFLLPSKSCAGKKSFGDGGVMDKTLTPVPEACTLMGKYRRSVDGYAFASWNIRSGGGYDITKESVHRINETVIYAGNVPRNHWGHFLIDYSTRLWYAVEHPEIKIAFCVKYGDVDFSFIPVIWRFLELLGIEKKRIILVSSIYQCKKIIIPEPSYIRGTHASKQYVRMFDIVASHINPVRKETAKMIYFTRTGYDRAEQKENGEKMLENLFSKNGFRIFSPEKYTLDEQIYMINSCKVIAGVSGSCLHNLLFANSKKICIVCNKTYILNLPQIDIFKLRNLPHFYIDAYECAYPTGIGDGPFLFMYNENLKSFIDDNQWNDADEIYKSSEYKSYNLKVFTSKIQKKILASRIKKKNASLSICSQEDDTGFFPLEIFKRWYTHYLLAYGWLVDKKIISEREQTMGRPIALWELHLAREGWIPTLYEGVLAEKMENKVEAIKVSFSTMFCTILYATYTKQDGWSKISQNGEMSGSTGKRKALNGVWMKLDEDGNKKYHIVYRVYFKNEVSEWFYDGTPIINDNEPIMNIEIRLERRIPAKKD